MADSLKNHVLHCVIGVQLLELVEGVDLDNVREGTGTNRDLVVIRAVVEGNLIPVPLLAAGNVVVHSVQIGLQSLAVLFVPVGDTEHMVAVDTAQGQTLDVARTAHVEAPVLGHLGGNA